MALKRKRETESDDAVSACSTCSSACSTESTVIKKHKKQIKETETSTVTTATATTTRRSLSRSHHPYHPYHPLQHYAPTIWLRDLHRYLLSFLHIELHEIIFGYAAEIELGFLYAIRPSWNESLEEPYKLSVLGQELFVSNTCNSHINSEEIVVFDVDTGRYLRSWPVDWAASLCATSGGVFVTKGSIARGLTYYDFTGHSQLLPSGISQDLIYVCVCSSIGPNNEEYLWTVGYEWVIGKLWPEVYYVDQWHINYINITQPDSFTQPDNFTQPDSLCDSWRWLRRWKIATDDRHWVTSEPLVNKKRHVKKIFFDQDELFVLFGNYHTERSSLEIFKSKQLPSLSFSSDECECYPFYTHDERKDPSESEVIWRNEYREPHDLIVNGNQIISTHNVQIRIMHRDRKQTTSFNIFERTPDNSLPDPELEAQGLAISNNRLFVAIEGNMCINVYT